MVCFVRAECLKISVQFIFLAFSILYFVLFFYLASIAFNCYLAVFGKDVYWFLSFAGEKLIWSREIGFQPPITNVTSYTVFLLGCPNRLIPASVFPVFPMIGADYNGETVVTLLYKL